MNDDLQLVLIIIGLIAIAGVLLHGYWSNKKEQVEPMADKPLRSIDRYQSETKRDADGFDMDGVGEVKIRSNNSEASEPSVEIDETLTTQSQPNIGKVDVEVEPVINEPSLGGVTRESEDQVQLGLAGFEETPEMTLSAANQEPTNKPKSKPRPKQATQANPATTADMNGEFNLTSPETAPREDANNEPASQAAEPEAPKAVTEPTDVLVLHVQAQTGEQLHGSELLPCLLTLGLKFGDMNIFHRHQDPAGTGRVIYSLANMMKPGTFDPDNMEQFKTDGVVLFLTLPCQGEAKLSFSTMLNAAQQLADDLNGVVTDEQRNPWNDASRAHYLERIRKAVH
ncbi:cell division protein ZipA [Paraferrimonas haliotis]|uniref:cell division protein ZipA n=1 Tax=Paraferrimonas haliotis TaxID=2013866 RepID=UPI000BA98508|nr:cell division protein ZipA [Paraferrimonas haliotis]